MAWALTAHCSTDSCTVLMHHRTEKKLRSDFLHGAWVLALPTELFCCQIGAPVPGPECVERLSASEGMAMAMAGRHACMLTSGQFMIPVGCEFTMGLAKAILGV